MVAREAKRMATTVRQAAALILAVEAWTGTVCAETTIEPGEWEFSSTVPEATQLPPGMQSSPGVRAGPEGTTFSRTECIAADNPLPPMARGRSAPGDGNSCAVDRTDVNGDTVSWSTTCTTPRITIHIEGTAHYHGETLDGVFVIRSKTPDGPPIERTQQLRGRYLGPCETK
jgi:hypothetical protein